MKVLGAVLKEVVPVVLPEVLPEPTAELTAEVIRGWRAPMIWEIRSDWDTPEPLLVVATTLAAVASSTPAWGPVHGPGMFLGKDTTDSLD